jgi:hypothetical protein
MDRITNPDRLDDDRHWTEGDPDLAIDPTPLAAKYMNDLQEEICNVIEGFKVVLDPNKQDQLYQVIKAAIGDADGTKITASGSNVNGHWRKWSDDVIEQWGLIPLAALNTAGQSNYGTHALPIAFPPGTKFLMLGNGYGETTYNFPGQNSIGVSGGGHAANLASFDYYYKNQYPLGSKAGVAWYARSFP